MNGFYVLLRIELRNVVDESKEAGLKGYSHVKSVH